MTRSSACGGSVRLSAAVLAASTNPRFSAAFRKRESRAVIDAYRETLDVRGLCNYFRNL